MFTLDEQLKAHLTYLTEITPARNWMNRESLDKASTYISAFFQKENYTIEEQKWNVGKFEYKNIIAKYKPELNTRLIVGAHYDVFSDQPGADDNASGVAGLLTIAAAIAKKNPSLPYGIDFVGYCLEEPPHFGTANMGSYIHAKSLSEQKVPIIGMICLDMIGYFDDKPNSQHYPSPEFTKKLPTTGDFISLVGLTQYRDFSTKVFDGMTKQKAVKVHAINFPSADGLAGLSDHRNYWHFGYPAVMINDTAIFRNPNYHKPTDTLATLNIKKMAAVVNAVLNALSTPLTKHPTEQKYKPENPENRKGKTRFFKWVKTLFKK